MKSSEKKYLSDDLHEAFRQVMVLLDELPYRIKDTLAQMYKQEARDPKRWTTGLGNAEKPNCDQGNHVLGMVNDP